MEQQLHILPCFRYEFGIIERQDFRRYNAWEEGPRCRTVIITVPGGLNYINVYYDDDDDDDGDHDDDDDDDDDVLFVVLRPVFQTRSDFKGPGARKPLESTNNNKSILKKPNYFVAIVRQHLHH